MKDCQLILVQVALLDISILKKNLGFLYLNEQKQDIAVIRHIISLARELGFVCLAEGAEHKGQIDELRSLGCDVIQGYYYSKPVPVAEYEEKYLN